MKTKLVLLLISIPFYFFSQTEKTQALKTISGFIKHKNKSLSNVNVFVENTTRFTVSDDKGFYSVKVKTGETVSYNYTGLKSKFILIEDVTSTLNITLKEDNNVIGINSKKIIKLGEGTIGDYVEDFKLIQIKGEELNKNASTLTKAILEKVPKFIIKINQFGEEIIYLKGKELNGPAIWIIDNISYDIPIPIFIDEVKEILVINQKEKGFTINVKTNIDYKKIKDINYDNFYFSNDDFYNYDATLYKKIKLKTPSYLNKYKKVKKEQDVLNLYLEYYSIDKKNTNFHSKTISFFEKEKFSKNLILKVLNDFETYASNNSEDLKTIAYKYQKLNEHIKAISVYKKIIKNRSNYSQSYRDLANAYLDAKDYRNVWLTYKYYLNKGFKIEESDIDEIIASEMISAYNLDSSVINQKIKIIKSQKNIASDVRLVFEWNTSEAEFILEFINPQLQVYTIENSAERNEDLIFEQKEKGYTSKEIFIENLSRGNWLVNFNYLGNKQDKSTTLKITTYYNWGRSNQTKKIDIFNFTIENTKAQLLKLNRRFFKS